MAFIGELLIGGIGALASGISGATSGNSSRDQQLEILKQIQDDIDNIQDPQLQEIIYQKYKEAGYITPEMEKEIQLGTSRMETVKIDPKLREAQMQALAKLQQVGTEGLTSEDRLAMDELNREVAQQENARQQSILQGMQQRGMGGAGAELAAQLSSSQSAAQSQQRASQQIAAEANKRALEAIMKSGQLGSDIRTQEFSEQEAESKAADAIAKANVEHSRDIQQRNISSRNSAQEANLNRAQEIADANVAMENKQRAERERIALLKYNQALEKQRAKSGAQQNMASYFGDQAGREEKYGAGLASSIGGLASNVGKSIFGTKEKE